MDSKSSARGRKYQKRRAARRPEPIALHLLRWGFRYLAPLMPGLAARYAYRLWFSTTRHAVPAREQQWEASAARDSVSTPYGEVAVYHWGTEGPTVLLIHGWNGRGTQLASFALPLVEAGYQVVAFDGPGHGRTGGSGSSIFRLSDATLAVANQYSPLHAVIAHSFGSAVTTYALNHGLSVSRVVSISAPASIHYLVERFGRALQLPGTVQQRLERRIEQRMNPGQGDLWQHISPEANARKLSGVSALIVHDREDHDVDVTHAQRLHAAWVGSELLETQGLGHRRILRHQATINRIVEFITHPE